MHELPSAAFRRTFPRLTEPTIVTVHGHPIGTWTPVTTAVSSGPTTATARRAADGHDFGRSRPAPKPGR